MPTINHTSGQKPLPSNKLTENHRARHKIIARANAYAGAANMSASMRTDTVALTPALGLGTYGAARKGMALPAVLLGGIYGHRIVNGIIGDVRHTKHKQAVEKSFDMLAYKYDLEPKEFKETVKNASPKWRKALACTHAIPPLTATGLIWGYFTNSWPFNLVHKESSEAPNSGHEALKLALIGAAAGVIPGVLMFAAHEYGMKGGIKKDASNAPKLKAYLDKHFPISD